MRSILTKSWKCFCWRALSVVWEYFVFLPQMENTKNLYPNFNITIMIVFTIVQVTIRYRDHPALIIIMCRNKISDSGTENLLSLSYPQK